jgi:hypothetical protein
VQSLIHIKLSLQGKLSNFGMITPLDVLNLHKIGNALKPYECHVIKVQVLNHFLINRKQRGKNLELLYTS